MRTGASLALIGIGAILALAVTAHNSVLNFNVAGYVIMIIGAVGLYLRHRGWVSRQILVRRTRSVQGRVVEEEPDVPVYVRIDPNTTPPQGMHVVFDDPEDVRQPVATVRPDTEIVEEREYRPD